MTEDYSGMTVNERLSAAGVIEAFDAAVSCRDKTKIVQILDDVGLNTDDIDRIIEVKLSISLDNDGQT